MTKDRRALIERLEKAASQLDQTLHDWQSLIEVPTLRQQQQNTIDVLREAISELSRLSRVEQALRWQPIDTAPKDGTTIIGALISDGRVWRVHKMKYNGLAFYTSSGGSLPRMTHWMPLPASPEAQPKEDQ